MDDKLKDEIITLIKENLSLHVDFKDDWGKSAIFISLKLNGETITEDYFYKT